MCYPDGGSTNGYRANDVCVAYNQIINSAEFQALAEQFPELKRFTANALAKKTIYMLKDGQDDNPTLADALELNGIHDCSVHNAQLLQELQNAIAEAKAALIPEPTEPEPTEPEPTEPEPTDPEPQPWP